MSDQPEIKDDAFGTKWWKLNGALHRKDDPAVEYSNGSKEWWVNGKRHREDGPAIELANGYKEWWENGHIHQIGRAHV